MFKIKTITTTTVIDNEYYNKNNYKFILCDFCYWCATIFKDIDKFNHCPKCKKKELYVERILR